MTDKLKLKPCPFCGHPAQPDFVSYDSTEFTWCTNEDCDLTISRTNENFFLLNEWNTRPLEDELQTKLTKQQELLERMADAMSDASALMSYRRIRQIINPVLDEYQQALKEEV